MLAFQAFFSVHPLFLSSNHKYIGMHFSIFKRFTHSGKGNYSRLVSSITNNLTRGSNHPQSISSSQSQNTNFNSPMNTRSEMKDSPGFSTSSVIESSSLPSSSPSLASSLTSSLDVVNKSFNNIVKGSIPKQARFPNEIREMDHFLRDKTLEGFLSVLSNTSNELSKNDRVLIQALLKVFIENPRLNSRYLQIAFEVAFPKKKFDLHDIETFLPKSFSLIDLFQLNGNSVNQSTLFTILQCWDLLSQPGFNSNIETNVIIQTAIKEFDPKNLDSGLLKFITQSQQATGNTSCDIKFNNHCYDYKFSMDNRIPLARNIIMPVQDYNEPAFSYFFKIYKKHLLNLQDTNNNVDIQIKHYYQDLYTKLVFLEQDNTLNLPPTKDTKFGLVQGAYSSRIATLDPISQYRIFCHTAGLFGSNGSNIHESTDSLNTSLPS